MTGTKSKKTRAGDNTSKGGREFSQRTTIAISLALVMVILGMFFVSEKGNSPVNDEETVEVSQNEDDQEEARRKEQRDAQRRELLEEIREHFDANVGSVQELVHSGELEAAGELLNLLEDVDSTNPRLASIREEYEQQARPVQARASIDLVRELLEVGQQHIDGERWLEAEHVLQAASEAGDGVEDEFATDELHTMIEEVERIRHEIGDSVAAMRELREEHDVYSQRCGRAPRGTSGGSRFLAVVEYLSRRTHNPDYIVVDECSSPILTESNCWKTTCRYRERNVFGAYVERTGTYYIKADDENPHIGRVFESE